MFDILNVKTIVFIIFGGIILAALVIYYNKKTLGGLLRKLAEKNANSKETAISLSELGYCAAVAKIISLSLGKNSSLSKYVEKYYNDDEEQALKEAGRKNVQKYYLSEEKRQTALQRYAGGENLKPWKLAAIVVACVAAAIICANVFPYLMSLLKNSTENFNVSDNVTGERIQTTSVQ